MTSVPNTSGRAWLGPVLVFGFLLLSVGANAALLLAASGDDSFAVTDNYYQKALAWDAHRAEEARSRRLGWQVHTTLTAGSAQALRLVLRDHEGQPVAGATVAVEAFHAAHAAHRHRLQLRETAPGIYTAAVGAVRPGLWVLRIEARRGNDRFLAEKRLHVAASL